MSRNFLYTQWLFIVLCGNLPLIIVIQNSQFIHPGEIQQKHWTNEVEPTNDWYFKMSIICHKIFIRLYKNSCASGCSLVQKTKVKILQDNRLDTNSFFSVKRWKQHKTAPIKKFRVKGFQEWMETESTVIFYTLYLQTQQGILALKHTILCWKNWLKSDSYLKFHGSLVSFTQNAFFFTSRNLDGASLKWEHGHPWSLVGAATAVKYNKKNLTNEVEPTNDRYF